MGDPPVPEDVERELESHIRMRTDELVALGWDPGDAREEARRVFGDMKRVRDECEEITRSHDRAVRRGRALDGLRQDLRYALRTLRKSPGFALVAVLTLALGIGANTAIFSVVDAVLLRPLPYQNPQDLVAVAEWKESQPGGMWVAWPNYLDWREQSRSFLGLAAYAPGSETILGTGQPVRARTARVARDFWAVFPMVPAAGRFTAPGEHVEGAPAAAVVGFRFWQDRLGGRPPAEVSFDAGGRTFQVVGVTPPGFDFPDGAEIWMPAEPEPGSLSRTSHNWSVVARLADGATLDRADRELDAITRRVVAAESGGEYSDWLAEGALVSPLHERVAGAARRPLLLLFGAATLVLLVACTNLASTLLARGTTRAREMAVRSSLGAGRARLVRQLLTESAVLAGAGGVAGVALAALLVRLLGSLGPSSIPRLGEVGLDGRVLLFGGLVSMGTALLFGLLPALRLSARDPGQALRSGGRGNARDGRGATWTLLVGAEMALALLLLVGSGLLIRSFQQVLGEDLGFDGRDVVVMDLDLSSGKYPDAADHARFHASLLETLQARPEIASVGLVSSPPLSGFVTNGQMELDGDLSRTAQGHYVVASAGFFEALDIPLIRGRLFHDRDGPGDAHVALVSRGFAETYWPGESAVGKQVTGGGMDDFWEERRFATVVGVVGDVRFRSLTRSPEKVVYFPYTQRPFRIQWASQIVAEAAGGAPGSLGPLLRETAAAMDADALPRLSTMDAQLSGSLAERRFVLLVFGGFGLVALVLVMVGVYGVVSWSVARRTREMGIRLALGARPDGVRRMVMEGALRMVVGGLVLGGVVALSAGQVMESLLYQVSPTDPLTLGVVLALLTLAAMLAAWVPALRSTRIDPMVTMRAE